MTATRDAKDAPYCSNCGYVLKGLTESSKCPECGKPLVEVLTRQSPAFLNAGKRYRSRATLFGWPVLDVALGPKDGELRGHAKGIIAIGGMASGGGAVGFLAAGGGAVGAVAQGGGALGMYTRDARGLNPAGAADAFAMLSWFFGPSLTSPAAMWLPMLVTTSLSVAAAAMIALVAWLQLLREPGPEKPGADTSN